MTLISRPYRANCPTCNATQVSLRYDEGGRAYAYRIQHEPNCPTLKARQHPKGAA